MVTAMGKSVKKYLVGINIVVVFLYLLVCLVPFLESGSFWFIAFLGLGFPILFVPVFLFLLIWSLKRSKWALLSLFAIVLSWQQLSVVFAYNFKKPDIDIKEDKVLRVISWNVSRWDERNKEKRGGQSFRNHMMDFINLQNADVLCLQEFFECHDPAYFEANIPALKKIGFEYHYFFPTAEIFEGKFQYGLAIFSRYPIIKAESFINRAQVHSEGLCFADIKIADRIVRVFNTHLESPGFNRNDFSADGTVKASGSVIGKLKRSYQFRNEQARIAKEQIKLSPYPVILCSDLGDVPNSYAYFRLKGDLKDAFLEKGSWFGRTYRFISPTLRIDYIFVRKGIKVKQFFRPEVPYSDHYPIIADLAL